MAGPIYKLWMFRPTEAWYQSSKEEQDNFSNKIDEDLEKVGGKRLIACTPTWSTERWLLFGVEEFPDIEAAALINPGLTTSTFPAYEMGMLAVQQLQDLLSGQEVEEDLILLESHLIIRQSCGCQESLHPG